MLPKIIIYNLKKELFYRFNIYIYLFLIIVFVLFNTIEYLNNYLYFFTELNLVDLEYLYYKDIYYFNIKKYNNFLEYDWYINYSILPIYYNNYQNTILNFYLLSLLCIALPYIYYEVYLFIIPACYIHEKFKFKVLFIYNIIIFILYIYLLDKNLFSLFFYWNEDPYIYLFNEWFDIFHNISNITKLYKFDFIFFIFFTNLFFYYNYYIQKLNIKSFKKLRYLNLIICIFIFLFNLYALHLETVFLLKYILYILIYGEQYYIYTIIKILSKYIK